MIRHHHPFRRTLASVVVLGGLLLACQPQPPVDKQATLQVQSLPGALQHALAESGAHPVGQGGAVQHTAMPPAAGVPPHSAPVPIAADTPACLAQVRGNAAQGGALRRWTDADGNTHYSDREPPAGMATDTISAGQVQTRISGHDGGVPQGLDQRVQAHVTELEALLIGALALPPRPAARLDIVLVAQQEALAALVASPLAATSSGAYIPAQQKVYLHQHESGAAFEQILRHELAHAMVHRLVGQLPVPLNEGFAGWFQHGGNDVPAGHVAAGLHHALASASPRDAEHAWVELLASESLHFHRDGREASYLRAYALVAVLMADEPGRRTLTAIMQEQREQPCFPVPVERLIAAYYPGGLAALMRYWQGFMDNPQAWVGIAS